MSGARYSHVEFIALSGPVLLFAVRRTWGVARYAPANSLKRSLVPRGKIRAHDPGDSIPEKPILFEKLHPFAALE